MMTDPVTPGGIIRGDVWAGAEFSPCGRYRFRLWRVCDRMYPGEGTIAWCMLNPSTADENVLDPTLRRVARFSREWDYERFVVVNLFAWRATDPDELLRTRAAIGLYNMLAIESAVAASDLVVCGWGSHRAASVEAQHILGIATPKAPLFTFAREAIGAKAHHLGLTKDDHPRHPLYLRGDVKPQPWTLPAPAVRGERE